MSVSRTAAPDDAARGLDAARRRFVDDLSQLFGRYGLALTVGRVLGLLLLSDDPLGLDDIAERLGVSKTGASVATRDLERVGVVRRLGTPGSRRVLYEMTDDVEPILAAQFVRVRHQLAQFQRADALLAPGPAKERLRELIALHEFWLGESEQIMDRWRAR
jgi:DNA-binding MarR family transcriptional regulator